MPVSQSDIDNLNAAIATGERQVTIGGQSITYRSIADMKAAIEHLRSEMARDSGQRTTRPRTFYALHAGRDNG